MEGTTVPRETRCRRPKGGVEVREQIANAARGEGQSSGEIIERNEGSTAATKRQRK